MTIKIHQIDENLDINCVSYASYDYTIKTAGHIDASIYTMVFEGDIECENLEDVFQKLNGYERPEYEGHSLSVSDIVQVCDENAIIPKGSYFCDTIGWRKIEGFGKEC